MIKMMSIFLRKRGFLLLIFLFITVVFSIVILVANKQQKTYRSKAQETISPTPEASPSAQIALLEVETEAYTSTLLNLLNEYTQGDEIKKQELLPQLMQNARERKKKMLEMLPLSPQSVYNKAFSKDILTQFPIEAQAILERKIDDIRGKINILHKDNFSQSTSYETLFFTDKTNPEKEYLFYPTVASSSLPFSSETEVIIKNGLIIDEQINNKNFSYLPNLTSFTNVVHAEEQETIPAQSHLVAVEIERINVGKPDSLGEQNLLVLLARYDDIKETELPSSDEIEVSFKKIQEFYDKNSYGRFTLVPEIVKKWYTLERSQAPTVFDDKFDDIYKSVLTQSYENNVNIQQYMNQRFVIIIGDNFNNILHQGTSSIGKSHITNIKNKRGEIISLGKISRAVLSLPTQNSPDFYQTGLSVDGQFSKFEITAIHELGHNIGADHASRVFNGANIFLPTSFSVLNKQTVFGNDNDLGLDFGTYIRKHFVTEEYGNPFDAMGNSINKALHFNAYIKKYFGWIGDESNGKYMRIDPAKPDGIYDLKLMGETGTVAAWFPFADHNPDDFFRVDYFLEYRKRTLNDYADEEGLAINIETRHTPPVLQPTFLFAPTTNQNLFQKGEYFIDNWNNICIKFKDINQEESSLTFIVTSRGKEKAFHPIPARAGNNNISSINVFESDLQDKDQKSIKLNERFITENQSLCDEKKYVVDKNSINITQGMLAVSTPVFDEDTTVKPKSLIDRFFSTTVRFNALVPNETTLSFSLSELPPNAESQGPFISQSLQYSFHLIPTPDEYRNDLEPFMVDIQDKDTNNKDFNHLETEKGQTLIFTSKIGNNSRNPDGNKSSDFIMKWYIEDEKGNNVIPPFTQHHDGIPPKQIDNEHPATLAWTIPQELKTGDYKVILKVDPNDRLQEFNENNNMIFRYLSLVE